VPFAPPPFTLQRLQARQYRRAVEMLLGPEAAAVVTPPEDAAVNGFKAIGNAQLSISTAMALRYESSAFAAADAALATPAQRAWLVGCDPSDACLRSFVARFGRRAFRRSLTGDEISAWAALGADAAATLNDFSGGVGAVAAAMLQSPDFLYLVEVGAPDPEHPGRWVLTGPELAARMAFFLTGGPPADALLDAAETGELGTDEGRRRWAWRLALGDGARAALREFWGEHLGLDALSTLAKDPGAFPDFSPALAADMREETLAFADDLVWDEDLDARELLRARFTFASGALADLYGIARPAGGFGRVELPAGGMRAGLLGQAAFLALRSHESQTSPTRRGLFVRERLLCEPVNQPPAQVGVMLPPPDGAVTMRQRLAAHRSNPACSGCHLMMDDIGLGLESFDGIGRLRTLDRGVEIDPNSDLDGRAFAGAAELGELLAEDPRVMRCLQRNLFRAAVGHVETPGEAEPMSRMEEAFAASGYRLRSLLVEIAAGDAFRAGAPPEVTP
ncbi:MAG TPA: DUF1588 domain-containing protein, partial [Myxococcaceae bacterium]|nr:DUF1588 domain-containing protein [Myxococcaceae bacterium]